MTDRRTAKHNKGKTAGRLAALMLCLLMMVMTAACEAKSDAEKKVAAELDALKISESTGSEVSDLRDSLSDEGRQNFDAFLNKLRDFDYEITGVSEDTESDTTAVTVRIITYDFGREYLAEWTEYLKTHDDVVAADDELIDFYEELFARLAAIEKKECIKDVEITCVKPLDNGEWIANIKDNEKLQDAVFGGMLSEMKTLAEEQ